MERSRPLPNFTMELDSLASVSTLASNYLSELASQFKSSVQSHVSELQDNSSKCDLAAAVLSGDVDKFTKLLQEGGPKLLTGLQRKNLGLFVSSMSTREHGECLTTCDLCWWILMSTSQA